MRPETLSGVGRLLRLLRARENVNPARFVPALWFLLALCFGLALC